MDWRRLISDFSKLVKVVVEDVGKNATAKAVGHDKATINRWLDGGGPGDKAEDVAALVRLALSFDIAIEDYQTFNPIYDFTPMLTYEQKTQNGVPKLGWLANPGVMLPSYPVKIGYLDTDCPLGIASSPLVADDRWISLMLNLGFGFATMKTRRLSKKPAWDPPHIAFAEETPDLMRYNPSRPPEIVVCFERPQINIPNLVNSMGVPSDDAADWEGTYEKVKLHRRGSSVGLSVMGESETEEGLKAEIAEVISKAADLHPPYIELNASCPNLEKNTNLYDEPDVLKEILQGAKKVIRNRSSLFIKIPWLPPSKLKELIRAVGPEVDGVVFRNTIRVRPIRSREGKRNPAFLGREFGGLSGPCTFPTTLSGTRELRALKLDLKLPFAIIAVGGASNHGEVVELMKAGADGVQACTTPMFDPFFALKVRYGLTRVPKALRNLPVAESSGTHLVLPRTGTENESFEQLQAAVNEISRRNPKNKPSFEHVARTWNAWMHSRATIIPGDARRTPNGKSKASWIEELLK